MTDPFLLNGANLSYIGDAYFELYIRTYLLNKGLTSQNKLHLETVKYVSANAHSKIICNLLDELTLKELVIYKRGRNSKSISRRKNLDISNHNESSGFEAVIGYLYLNHENERLEELIRKAIEVIEK